MSFSCFLGPCLLPSGADMGVSTFQWPGLCPDTEGQGGRCGPLPGSLANPLQARTGGEGVSADHGGPFPEVH